jgi:hypothetical protein
MSTTDTKKATPETFDEVCQKPMRCYENMTKTDFKAHSPERQTDKRIAGVFLDTTGQAMEKRK